MTHQVNVRIRRFASLLFFGVCLLQSHAACAEQQLPNILFLFADDQPSNCLGRMGNDREPD
ncbi:hypothetical protein [Novipirellula artificiosorum]|uniref:Sulfatase n=1 Tax=Novipirellula artificiosorum TaxID=2528016 RepID=A0A5C6DBP5_9BACT|nr:hypothetical protein [Novipirellula artificiosorum]TWU33197.1 hypothetical protein Poly41_49490 [Novipirellula artificiosorum]